MIITKKHEGFLKGEFYGMGSLFDFMEGCGDWRYLIPNFEEFFKYCTEIKTRNMDYYDEYYEKFTE